MIVQCKQCNTQFDKKPSQIKRSANHFCSQSCSATFNNKGIKRNYTIKPGPKAKLAAIRKCLNCDDPVNHSQAKFCSSECHCSYKKSEFIRKWQAGEAIGGNIWGISDTVRNYLLDKYDHKCSRCGWCEVNTYTGKIPLETEHIDGDWNNCQESNLTILCPSCHSLTPTFRSKNKGKGRYSVFKAMGKTPYGPGAGS